MSVEFHTLERSYWLNADTPRPYGLGYITRVIKGLCLLTPSSYDFYTKKIHINLAAITKMRDRGMQPPALCTDSVAERVCVNIERQAVRKAIHESGEDIYHPLNQYEFLDEVMRKSNPGLTPDKNRFVERLREVKSNLAGCFRS